MRYYTTMSLLVNDFNEKRESITRLGNSYNSEWGISSPATDHNGKAHDLTMFKSLLDSITDLA
jgi:hypothetical protein